MLSPERTTNSRGASNQGPDTRQSCRVASAFLIFQKILIFDTSANLINKTIKTEPRNQDQETENHHLRLLKKERKRLKNGKNTVM